MFYRRYAIIFFILILVFLLIIPGMAFADDSDSGTQQEEGPIRIEVNENGFNNTSGEFLIEAEFGQEIEIVFIYAENTSKDNPHLIYISEYNILSDTLNQDNPEITVKFIANKFGIFSFNCILDCAGHRNLQGGKISVFPTAGQGIMTNAILVLDTPDQAETGQPMTLTAQMKDEFDEPIAGFLIKFFAETDFFINGLMEIGEEITDEQGFASVDYIPDQAGTVRIVARNEVGNGFGSVEGAERKVEITGNAKSFYQTLTGIQFPNGLLIWMVSLVAILLTAWSIFFYVLYQVRGISRSTGTKGISLILMIIVVILFTGLLLILITQEPQNNFNLFPS